MKERIVLKLNVPMFVDIVSIFVIILFRFPFLVMVTMSMQETMFYFCNSKPAAVLVLCTPCTLELE
jgi:hypothetical protein